MPTLLPFEREDGMKIDPDRLVYEMGKNLMNAEALSKASGVSRVTISRIINGKAKNPYPTTVKALCDALQCLPADILEEPR